MHNVADLPVLGSFSLDFSLFLVIRLHSASLLEVLLSQAEVCVAKEVLFLLIITTASI